MVRGERKRRTGGTKGELKATSVQKRRTRLGPYPGREFTWIVRICRPSETKAYRPRPAPWPRVGTMRFNERKMNFQNEMKKYGRPVLKGFGINRKFR